MTFNSLKMIDTIAVIAIILNNMIIFSVTSPWISKGKLIN